MTPFHELAARVEAATGVDRELDQEIALAVGWYPPGVDPRLYKDDKTNALYAHRTPAYTASLDAAMGLATGLERFGGVGGMLREAMDRMYALPVMLSQMSPDEYRTTLARYFTAAALRARALTQGEKE